MLTFRFAGKPFRRAEHREQGDTHKAWDLLRVDQHRLATLDAFLESQRQLLTRTQADLHKLAALRENALAHPEDFVEDMEDILDETAFQLSEYDVPEVPEEIDWDLFASVDPSVFNRLPIPGPPPLTDTMKQVSPPSELQAFVRQAAKDILGDFCPYIPPDEDGSQNLEEAANEQRLGELVNSGKPNIPSKPIPTLPRRRVGSGLRLKHESDALAATWGVKEQGKAGQCKDRFADQPPESTPHVRLRSQRLRRPTMRPDEMYTTTSPTTLSPKPPDTRVMPPKAQTPAPTHDQESVPPKTPGKSKPEQQNTPKSRKRGAPSETFNQPWTPDEQNHLERLLEEIPAGEKNRWAKISKEMAGKRTPRQVASRVQKYFEKLRKFGVEPG